MISIEQAINHAIQSSQEKREKKRWYGSDLGKCLSGAYYARLGKVASNPPDDRTLRVFECGKLFERFVIETIKKLGDQYEFEQPETIYIEKYDMAVRPDLLVKNKETGERTLYELKSVHSRKFWWMEQKKEGPDRHYCLQTWAGMLATGIGDGRLVYVSKDDLCTAEYALKLVDNDLATQAYRELETLNLAWNKQEPPPAAPAVIGGKINWVARYCPYHVHCTGNPNWLKEAEAQVKVELSTPGYKRVKRSRY